MWLGTPPPAGQGGASAAARAGALARASIAWYPLALAAQGLVAAAVGGLVHRRSKVTEATCCRCARPVRGGITLCAYCGGSPFPCALPA
ncbi:hypothetical protein DF3PA_250029 [Candidatus Defluviicoccus seviourii]|uniref:Uncharacterized protein n=1 Tax=Candidatus Defluviicoccus seviourii TaxID=2565273 RepID=A0A564WDR6_9PROT|nr:hypothetical protein DF3PA_250029 [Candidatus Defluviicoccus seviourii]